MDWQWALVALAVVGAFVYLARTAWRTWVSAKGVCGGSCNCSGAGKEAAAGNGKAMFLPADQLTLRRRGSARS
jgi:hypothetical protein